MTAYFAPDTNFFLQCRPAEDLPWGEFTEALSIVLVVVREVQRELDRHKNGGNARRARRAREVSGRLRGAINGTEVELASSDRRISIRLAPRLDPDRPKPKELDLTVGDERIVEEVFACGTYFQGGLVLLTNDMAPLQMALEVGVDAKAIPDTWLLPPEPNDLDKEVRQLRREVELLKGAGPSIRIAAEQDGKDVARLVGDYFHYPDLSQQFIDQAISAITANHPFTNTDDLAYVSFIAVDQYRVHYGSWVTSLRGKLQQLASFLNTSDDPVGGRLVLTNVGIASAEHLLVDLNAKGSIRLVDHHRRSKLLDGFQMFPAPPTFKNEAPLYSSEQLRVQECPMPDIRGRPYGREFLWTYDAPSLASQHCQGECEDFRHGLGTQETQLFLRPAVGATDDVSGALQVRVSAKNMPVPIEMNLPIRLSCRYGDTEQKAREILKQELDVNL